MQAEGSFIFDRGGHVSSTPLSGNAGRAARQGADESWDDSLESPFDRVERQLHGLDIREDSSGAPTPSLPSGYSLPGIPNRSMTDSPELPPNSFNAGRINDSIDGSPDSLEITPKAASRVAPRPRAQRQNQLQTHQTSANPFSTNQWNGIADLRTTPLNSFKAKGKARAPKPSLANTIDELRAMDAMDKNELPMSPPVTTTWNLPPRAQGIFNVGRTPAKGSPGGGSSRAGGGNGQQEEVGARRILDDLMEEMQQGYEPSPRMPTPEGLGRYSIVPSDLGGVGKRLFEPEIKAVSSSHPAGGRARASTSRNTRRSMANTSFGSDILDEAPDQPTPINEDDSLEMDDLSVESAYGATTIHDMQGINMAPVEDLLGDESILSSPGGGSDGQTQRSEAGMLFGSNVAGEAEARVPGKKRGTLSLHKLDEMSTFRGGKLLDAAGSEVRQSPIAAVRGERGRDLFAGKQ